MSVRRRVNKLREALQNHPSPRPETPGEVVEAQVTAIDGRPVYQADLQPPTALVIHCADPRFQEAYRRFLAEELGIRHYVPIVMGGGIHALGAQTFLPKNFKVAWQQVKFMVENFGLKEVIFINHDDCRWYQKLSGYHPMVDVLTKGRFDLIAVGKLLLQDFAEIRIRSYWASLDGDRITFSEVHES